jgi:hypothetical protein
MASQAPQGLPLFYKDLVPLSQQEHAGWHYAPIETADFLKNEHAVPLTIDEFPVAQRHYPIIFSSGDQPVPLALMGLNEGVNTFVKDDGKIDEPVYVPAYVRRYPYLLARLRDDSDELSLCIDPTAGAIAKDGTGEPIFEGQEISEQTRNLLQFLENFEQAGQRTAAFVQELKDHDLLMEGEVSIQQTEGSDPFVYRGFQMINEEKLRELRGDVLRKMNQSGALPLIYAHLFSVTLMRDIFGRQVAQGKTVVPGFNPQA